MNEISSVAHHIITDWSGNRFIEGIAYFLYRRNPDGSPDPLYVGISSSSNKRGDNYNSLWKNNRGARFTDAYGFNSHVDCLSRALLEGERGYADWVTTLFNVTAPIPLTGQVPALRQPVFVHIELWNAHAHRILPATPNAPLYVEEMLRLWILKLAGFGGQLLNRDGN